MTYLPFVDGLRAVAIIAVVGYHALPSIFPGGFIGVDVFFVISGFLITRLLATEMTEGRFSLARFFVRRARRLLPAALTCFAAVAALSAVLLYPDAYWNFGRSLLSAVLMYANYFFLNTGGYFSAPALEKPLLHIWSLSLEDQFYLTWPVLLWLLIPRLPMKAVIATAVALLAASLIYAEYRIADDPEFAFFMLPTRGWELLIGGVLALAVPYYSMSRGTAEVLAGTGLAMIGLSCMLVPAGGHFPGLGALPSCAGTVAVIAGGLKHRTFAVRLLAWRPAVFVGLISYSLYLWHWPLISLVSYKLERPMHPLEAAGVIAASVAIAVASWHWIERPWRSGHADARTRAPAGTRPDMRFAAASVAGILLLAGVALTVKFGKGFPERFAAVERVALQQMVSSNPERSLCDNFQNVFLHDDACNFGAKRKPGGSYDVALFGDSMSDQWTPAVAQFAAEHGLAGRQVTNGGCVLLFNAAIPAHPAAKAQECASYQQQAAKFLDANPGLKIAVVAAYWEKWISLIEDGDWSERHLARPAMGPAAKPAAKFDAALAGTLKAFTDRGIKVVLIGQIPVYDVLPVRCILSALRTRSDVALCGLTKEAATEELARSNAALSRAAAAFDEQLTLSLPLSYMCQDRYCSPMLNGTMLYRNASHLNRFGSMELYRFLRFPAGPWSPHT